MHNELIKSDLPNISVSIRPTKFIPNCTRVISEPHFHDELEILQILAGKFKCISNGVSYIAEEGDILFINSRVPHSTYSLENNTFSNLLQFSSDNFSNASVSHISKYLMRFINVDKKPIFLFKKGNPQTTELASYLNNIFNEYKIKKTAYEIYIKSNILNIIAFMSRYSILTDSSLFFNEKDVEKVLPALSYIDKNYSEQISLDDLSKTVNLNSSYFCRLFKKATNSTFIEYLNFVRVCKSEQMLSSSTKSISDISSDLGFASVSYFNRVFKRFKGCTPTEYKKNKFSLQ